MLPAGTAAKVERRDRDDYVGTDIVQVDGNGRAVMSVVTTRDNGQDVIVFAPLATGREQNGMVSVESLHGNRGGRL